ncbi:hypothetical protein NTGZN8_240017 [Candidatus Nitrotoga fabula]|uniref:Uncharacterized protein n=1 Tax=Candidatus Nitrotoga fabula TaxID=2182327 RepID=A0A916FAC8_9PROT|nr:hypothetical protein NTGZN8_240017 [Candidatus Nitrotoga fabula]
MLFSILNLPVSMFSRLEAGFAPAAMLKNAGKFPAQFG